MSEKQGWHRESDVGLESDQDSSLVLSLPWLCDLGKTTVPL